MPKIIIAILTKNTADHIGDCIKSALWADGIILEDSFSTDGTVKIAESLGARVFQNAFVNFAVARETALANAHKLGADWVFFLDADERITMELAQEIRQVVHRGDVAGWWVPRFNVMWGHVMQGGGWYPDYQLRLLRVDSAHYDLSRRVHEYALLDGPAGYLREHFIHYNYDSLAQFRRKQSRYINFEAEILKEQGITIKPWTYLTMPLREFHRRYIALEGYKDGWVGLQVCGLMAWYTLMMYLRLRHL